MFLDFIADGIVPISFYAHMYRNQNQQTRKLWNAVVWWSGIFVLYKEAQILC